MLKIRNNFKLVIGKINTYQTLFNIIQIENMEIIS